MLAEVLTMSAVLIGFSGGGEWQQSVKPSAQIAWVINPGERSLHDQSPWGDLFKDAEDDDVEEPDESDPFS